MDKKNNQLPSTNGLYHPTDPEAIHKFYLNILRSMPNNVYWLTKDCITLGCNDNVLKMLRLTQLEDFVGINYEQMGKIANWVEGQAESFQRDDMEVISTGKPKINIEEPPVYDENGNPRYYVSTRVPLYDQNRDVIGLVGISVDITERKNMEEELRISKDAADNANRSKSEFIANMSHDLRTPLAGIVSMAKDILGNTKEPDTKDAAQYLVKASHILLNLLNQVIEFSKSETGELPVAEIRFNPKRLMETLNELLAPAAQTKHLQFIFNCDPNVPTCVIGDEGRLHRILLNLISNAIKFTDEGCIEISIKMAESEHSSNGLMLIFTVRDTGIGIPKEKQEVIFSKFTKISPSYTGRYKGYGLGLFTVKKLLSEIDGRVHLQSWPDKGSLFTLEIPFERDLHSGSSLSDLNEQESYIFDNKSLNVDTEILLASLPASKADTEIIQPPTSEQASQQNTANYKILIVEDNEMARFGAVRAIQRLNCKVDTASNGEEALLLANKNDYDLIFMDIGLPDKDGIQVTSEIRVNNKHTPIVALTAHVDQNDAEQCLRVGMQEVFNKPLDEIKLKKAFQYIRAKQTDEVQKESATNTFLLDQNLPVIDKTWPQSSGYGTEMCKEMLDNFIKKDIPEFEKDAKQAYQAADWKQLKFHAHKFHGGACYSGVPRIKECLQQLESLLSKDTSTLPASQNHIDSLYQKLTQEIKKLVKEYKSLTSTSIT